MNRQGSIFGLCINLKIVAAVGAAGVAVFLVAPRLALAALPFLLVAICPLSCIWMMRGMRGSDQAGESIAGSREDHLAQLEKELAQLRGRRPAATPAEPASTESEIAGPATSLLGLPSRETTADRPVPS